MESAKLFARHAIVTCVALFIAAPAATQTCESSESCSPSSCASGVKTAAGCDVSAVCDITSACGAAARIDIDPALHASEQRPPVTPESLGFKSLDRFLEPVRARYRVPALAAAVVRSDGVFAVGAVGVRVAGGEERVTPVDRFHLGSCTKSVTASVAARLVERGEIGWKTTIADAFPDYVDTMRPEYRDVTLAQLLAHRSGIPAVETGSLQAVALVAGDIRTQRQAFVRVALTLPPAAPPGTAFVYTDIGYTVAGAMLERASGTSWEALVQEHVGRVLGLESLGFGEPADPGKTNQPWGHLAYGARTVPFAPGPFATIDNPPVIAPAGLLHLSIVDWATYAGEHLKGARGQESVLLAPAAYKILQADAYQQNYALGWGVSQSDYGRVLTHTGSCGEWFSVIWVAPEADLAVVVATNLSGGNGAAACSDVLRIAQAAYIE